jgi:hypothetical protein
MLLCLALTVGHQPDHQPIRRGACLRASGSASAHAVHRLVLIERSLASRPAFHTGFVFPVLASGRSGSDEFPPRSAQTSLARRSTHRRALRLALVVALRSPPGRSARCPLTRARHVMPGTSARERYETSGPVPSEPVARSARGSARRRVALSRQSRLGCRYAPRPGRRAWGSGTMSSPATTRRSKADLAARSLQPTQVRTGKFPGRSCICPTCSACACSGGGCPDLAVIPSTSLPRQEIRDTAWDPATAG